MDTLVIGIVRRHRHNFTLPLLRSRFDDLTTQLSNHFVKVLFLRVRDSLITHLIRHRNLQSSLESRSLSQLVVPCLDVGGFIDVNADPIASMCEYEDSDIGDSQMIPGDERGGRL